MASRYVAIYPTGSDDPTGEASEQGPLYDDAWTTMALMESNENGSYTGGDILYVEIIPSTGSWTAAPDASRVTFDGWETDKAGTGSCVEIKSYGTARSSTGLWDTDAYIITNASETIRIDNDVNSSNYLDIEFDGIQCNCSGASNAFRVHNAAYHKQITILNSYFTNAANAILAIFRGDDDTNEIVRIKNCIFTKTGGHRGIDFVNQNANTYLYNCTISAQEDDQGVDCGTNTNITVKNCAVFENTDDWVDQGNCTMDYNASDDNDGGGANNVAIGGDAASWMKCFNDYATQDFRINSPETPGTDTLKWVGETQNNDSEVPAYDIAGTERPSGDSQVSIGAFDIASEAPSEPPVKLNTPIIINITDLWPAALAWAGIKKIEDKTPITRREMFKGKK